jgi:hypothetical protein
VSTFESQGLVFALDKSGAEVGSPEIVQIDVACEDADIDPARAPEIVGERLSRLLDVPVSDEEGIFDLVVSKDGAVVAALVVACEDEALALGGERTAAVTDFALASALVEALRGVE